MWKIENLSHITLGCIQQCLHLTDFVLFTLTEAIQAAKATAEGLPQEAAEGAEAGPEGEAQWALPQ